MLPVCSDLEIGSYDEVPLVIRTGWADCTINEAAALAEAMELIRTSIEPELSKQGVMDLHSEIETI
jgi:hypothetical protein